MDRNVESGVIVFICGLMGIILAFIEYDLHGKGVLLDEFAANTVTISDVMAITIVIMLIIGVLLGGLRR